MLAYLIFKLGSLLVPWVPEGIASSLALLLGDLFYLLLRPQRKAVMANLRRVLGPAAAPKVLRHTARQVFRHVALNYYDLLRLPSVDPYQLNRRVAVHQFSYLEEELTRGRGAIVVTAHLGNFELLARQSTAHSIPAIALVEPLYPPRLLALVNRLRSTQGVRFIPASLGALRQVVRTLKKGGMTVLACDRDIQGRGGRCSFFGEETRLPTGAVELALRTGASLVPAFVTRHGDGRYEVTVEPPIRPDSHLEYPEALQDGLRQIAAVLEKHIGAHPEQWVVLQPLWESQSTTQVEETPLPQPSAFPLVSKEGRT